MFMTHKMTPDQLSAIAELNVALKRAVETGAIDLLDTEHSATVMDFIASAAWIIDALEGMLRVTKAYQGCGCTFRQWLLGVATDPEKLMHCEARAYMSAGGNTENHHAIKGHDPQAIANNA